MNWDQIERQWQRVSKQIMLTWGEFTEDDLVSIGGDRDPFIGLYSQHCGGSDKQATSSVDDFARSLALPSPARTSGEFSER